MQMKPEASQSTRSPTLPGAAAATADNSANNAANNPHGLVAHFSDYLLLERLHGGTTAEVWRARDMRLERDVAIKSLPPARMGNRVHADALRREARLLGRHADSHIVRLHNVLETPAGPFLVMEYLAGETLAARLARTGAMSAAEAVAIYLPVLAALARLHKAGVIHGAVTPAHIFLGADGDIKLIDFGAAFFAGALPPAVAIDTEQLHYCAPELLSGATGAPTADIYSLALGLIECLTGAAREALHSSELPATVPAALVEIVARARAVDPSLRPADATGLRDALLGVPLPQVAATPTPALPRPARQTGLWRDNFWHTGFAAAGRFAAGARVELVLASLLIGLVVTLGLHPWQTTPRDNRAEYALEHKAQTVKKDYTVKASKKQKENPYRDLQNAWGANP